MVRGFGLGARLGFGVLAGLQAGWACTCIDVWQERSVQSTVDQSAWVFVGQGLGVPRPIPEILRPGEVLQGFTAIQSVRVLREGKGPRAGDTVEVLVDNALSSCAFYLPPGESMLVVADEWQGLVSVHRCGGSRRLAETMPGGVEESFVQEILEVAGTAAALEPRRSLLRPSAIPMNGFPGSLPLSPGTVPGHTDLRGRRPKPLF